MPRLSVSGPYEFTDLRVLGSALQELASGTGSIYVELPPGIYRIQARAPGAFTQRFVALSTEQDIHAAVLQRDLPLDSPAPTPRATTSNDTHRAAARRESQRTHVRYGESENAHLFLFVRSDGSPRAEQPALRIETGDGEVVARLGRDGLSEPDLGYAALSIALPAGTYALVHEAPNLGNRAQAVFVEDGWQTQVFVPWDSNALDPARSLINMVPADRGFDDLAAFECEELEAALDGLARGRLVLHGWDVSTFPNAVLANPMLSLIGAYAYLWSTEAPAEGLQRITDELLGVLPHSPDVHLLHQVANPLSRSSRASIPLTESSELFDTPPIFAVGAERLLDRAAEEIDLVPDNSWLAQVAATRTSGSVWTRWDRDVNAEELTRALLDDITTGHPRGDSVEWARRSGLPRSVVEGLLVWG